MQLHKRYLPLVALLGAAAAVIPSMASSATPPMTATVSGTESIMWSPMEVTIAPGGTVTFQDTSKSIPHGVVWESGPETPACSGVPINEGRTSWKGTCTFAREGAYHYYCYVHGMNMSGTIDVTDASTTTTSTTTSASTTTTPTQTDMSMPGMTTSEGEAPPGQGGGTDTTGGSHSGVAKDTLSGSALSLAFSQRGSVRGSLAVAQASSRLAIELLVPADVLGGSHHAHGALLAGRLLKAHVTAGYMQFRVSLTVAARKALVRFGRLSLTVKIRLTPPVGAAVTRTLHVVLRR